MGQHIAFLNIPAFGHLSPTLPVVRELVRRGHRVTYAVAQEYAELVAGAGAEPFGYPSVLSPHFGQDGSTEMTTETTAWSRSLFLRDCAEVLPLLESRFAGDVPDLFVHDLLSNAAGRILGRKLDRPVVQSVPVLASNEHYSLLDSILEFSEVPADHPAHAALYQRAGELLHAHGITDRSADWLVSWAAEDSLVYLPREFQPCGETFDGRHAFVGPCLSEEEPADWPAPAADRELVLVSGGTMSGDRFTLFGLCAETFAGTGWEAVLALGKSPTADQLGPLPPNVRAAAWVPFRPALERASVLVSHGGMGSVMQALYCGTPLVVVPGHPDCRSTARRVRELGLGAVVPLDEANPERLRAAIDEVAADDGIRERVRRMRERVRDAGGVARAADELETRAGVPG